MPVKNPTRSAARALGAVLFGFSITIILLYFLVPWNQVMMWVMTTQAKLHHQLVSALKTVSKNDWVAMGPLISLSLLYGIFHAAGPGHGKAVITTYLGTSQTRLRRGIFLSVSSALVQGLVAIILVEVVANLLGYSLRYTQRTATTVEQASFVFITLLGAVLALRNGKTLYRYYTRPRSSAPRLFTQGAKMQAYCVECGGPHLLHRDHLHHDLTWRSTLAIIFTIGLRPCTGAILVLLGAYALGLRWAGILAVIAMSLGTAFTVSLLAITAVSFRQVALKLFQRQPSSQRTTLFFPLIGLFGGGLIFFMGIRLFQHSLATPANPLF